MTVRTEIRLFLPALCWLEFRTEHCLRCKLLALVYDMSLLQGERAGKRCWELSQDDDSLGVPAALGMIPADGHVCCSVPADDDDYVGLRVSK